MLVPNGIIFVHFIIIVYRQSHELTGEKIASDREKAKNGLVEMYSTLCEALDPNGLTRHLYSSGLLSTEERDVIQACPTRLEKSEEILKAIERRSKDDIFSFCTILLAKGERTSGIMLKDGECGNNKDCFMICMHNYGV